MSWTIVIKHPWKEHRPDELVERTAPDEPGLAEAVDRMIEAEACTCPGCAPELAEKRLPYRCPICTIERNGDWWNQILLQARELNQFFLEAQ